MQIKTLMDMQINKHVGRHWKYSIFVRAICGEHHNPFDQVHFPMFQINAFDIESLMDTKN